MPDQPCLTVKEIAYFLRWSNDSVRRYLRRAQKRGVRGIYRLNGRGGNRAEWRVEQEAWKMLKSYLEDGSL